MTAVKLDDLRLIILNERESGKLSEIQPKTFEEAQEYLRSLYREVSGEARTLDCFLTDRAGAVLEEINSVRETLEEIVRLRTRKILKLALLQTESRFIDRAEIKRMLPSEKQMFEEISGAIERCRHEFMMEYPPVRRTVPGEEEIDDLQDEGVMDAEAVTVQAEGQGMSIVRILEDTGPFMGIDGRIYTLHREDVVSLPERNARVLCNRNIALNIRLSK